MTVRVPAVRLGEVGDELARRPTADLRAPALSVPLVDTPRRVQGVEAVVVRAVEAARVRLRSPRQGVRPVAVLAEPLLLYGPLADDTPRLGDGRVPPLAGVRTAERLLDVYDVKTAATRRAKLRVGNPLPKPARRATPDTKLPPQGPPGAVGQNLQVRRPVVAVRKGQVKLLPAAAASVGPQRLVRATRRRRPRRLVGPHDRASTPVACPRVPTNRCMAAAAVATTPAEALLAAGVLPLVAVATEVAVGSSPAPSQLIGAPLSA